MDSPQATSTVVSSSPDFTSPGGRSRYGRTRRPKISHDFCNIDDVIIDEIPPKVKSPLARPPIHQDVVVEVGDEVENFGVKGVTNIFKGSAVRENSISVPQDLAFEINDEFTTLDDLGMKVANNFKTSLHRGLDDSIKERKFFKSTSEAKMEMPNVVDVTKVLKLITKSDCETKTPTKTTLKTYSNRRKYNSESNDFIVESFGLPDEPIIPIKSPSFKRNAKIDIDLTCENDVNLPTWKFDDFFSTESFGSITDVNFVRERVTSLCSDGVDKNKNFKHDSGVEKNDIFYTPISESVQQERSPSNAAKEEKLSKVENVVNEENQSATITGKKRSLESSPVVGREEIKVSPLPKKAKVDNDTPKRVLRSNGISDDVVLKDECTEEEESLNINQKSLRSSSLSSLQRESLTKPMRRSTKSKNRSPKVRIMLKDCMRNGPNAEDTEVKQEVKTEEEFKPIIPKSEVIEFEIGDLVWAKIGTFPYWPCMVTEEPVSKTHKRFVVNRIQPMYHVRFFGDKGRRSWVSAQHIILFYGKDDLDILAKTMKEQCKLNGYIRECCSIRSTLMPKWQRGVDEAVSLIPETVQGRLDFFFEMFATEREKKRRMKELQKLNPNWKPKPKNNFNIDIKTEIDDDEVETPSSTDQSPRFSKKEEFTEEALEARKKLRNPEPKERKKPQVAQISEPKNTPERDTLDESSDARKKLRSSQINEPKDTPEMPKKPEASESRKKLRSSQIGEVKETPEVPKSPKDTPKPTRNSTEGTEDPEVTPRLRNKRHQINSDISNSDTDSKVSDNSSVPASLEAQGALYRRNNIFRGIPKEKVCQVCEKGGEVFKCKGPCSGVYHYDCAMKCNKEEVTEVEKPEPKTEEKNNVEIISVEPKKPLPALSTSPDDKGMSLSEKIDLRMKEIMKKFEHQSVYSESTDSSSEEYLEETSKNKSKLSLTVTSSPTKKEVPIIKHITADNISYVCVTDEPKDNSQDVTKQTKCAWCSTEQAPLCLVCNRQETKLGSKQRQKCSLHQCGKYYHPVCLKMWPQTQWSLIQKTDSFVCPSHVCHTCISDDPRAANSRCTSDKVVKCLRCPATYHSSNYCVPAGSLILSTSQIVCPRHFTNEKRRHFQQTINTNWCFICSKGGNLICCETCPTSVHVECLPGDLNKDDTFYCEDCQSGRLPLYDEIVWVKLGSFRWWPAVILFPNDIPDNVKNIPHNKGEFVVKFYGTYDHYWVGRGRTFLFQEGDEGQGHTGHSRKRMENAFNKAIEEAAMAHELKKQFKMSKIAEKYTGLKPPPYIRIKVNKPVGNVRQFDGNTSNTTSCDCDPNQPHPCGPDSDCLNRLLLTECNPEICPAGDRCNNQCFEKREYPPLVPHRTQVRGWGLKTLAPIRKGQFVIEYVGEMIDEQEYQRRVQKMHEQKEENYYFLTIDKDRTLDAGPKGNVARFMNHSCQPNCETQKWTVNGDTRVGLFATCDIPAGSELTFNYNLECIGKEKKICRCGAPNCSGFIGVKVKTDNPPKKASKPKKKKTPPPVEVVNNESPCFICGKQGNVGACNNKICTKYYHLGCVGLQAWPEGGKWVCQWHNCNFCSKRTIRCCVKCVNSYCPPHSEGNVRYDKLLGFVCTEHDPTKETNNDITPQVPTTDLSVTSEEGAVTSTTFDESAKSSEEDATHDLMTLRKRMNGCVTSTPVKKRKTRVSQEENVVSSVSSSNVKKIKKKKKMKVIKTQERVLRNTAIIFNPMDIEVKLSKYNPPERYLRTSRSSLNKTDPEKDLPIRKRTRLRCGNTL